jgi:hypothetical protein
MEREELGWSDDSDDAVAVTKNEALFQRPSAFSALSLGQTTDQHKKKLKLCVTEYSYAVKTIAK